MIYSGFDIARIHQSASTHQAMQSTSAPLAFKPAFFQPQDTLHFGKKQKRTWSPSDIKDPGEAKRRKEAQRAAVEEHNRARVIDLYIAGTKRTVNIQDRILRTAMGLANHSRDNATFEATVAELIRRGHLQQYGDLLKAYSYCQPH